MDQRKYRNLSIDLQNHRPGPGVLQAFSDANQASHSFVLEDQIGTFRAVRQQALVRQKVPMRTIENLHLENMQ